MKIEKIKAALAKQAQLLGVSLINKSDAQIVTVTAPAVVAKKETVSSVPTILAAPADSVPVTSNTTPVTPVTISANPKINTKRIPSESNATVSVSSSSTIQTPTLLATDSVQPPVSLVHANQLSLQPEPFLVPEEPKLARKAKKKVDPLVIVETKSEPIEIIVAKHLKVGRDYDRLPNTSKPTLFKSGAEILCGVFGFRITAQVTHRIEDYEKQFILYEVQVTVYGADDKTVAEGIGSCNSKERKYLRGDFATQLNTILKMAKKRAYVDAILTACHASKVFTQDVEDIAAGVADEVSTKKGA